MKILERDLEVEEKKKQKRDNNQVVNLFYPYKKEEVSNPSKVKEIVDFIKNIEAEDMFKDIHLSVGYRDASFTEAALKNIAMVIMRANNLYIDKEIIKSECVNKELEALAKSYMAKKKDENVSLKNYLMHSIIASLYDKEVKKMKSRKNYYPYEARENIKKINQNILKIEEVINNLSFNYHIEDLVKEYPYISASYKRNAIIFYDDLLYLELPLDKELMNNNIFNEIVEFHKSEFIKTLERKTRRVNAYLIKWVNIYKETGKNKLDIGLDFGVFHNNDKVTIPAIKDISTGKIERLSGEEIKTPEALVFQISVELDTSILDMNNSSKDVDVIEEKRLAKEKALNMFLGTLNKYQKKMYKDLGIVLLEGDKYYYIATKGSFNYLVRFKKDLKQLRIGDQESFESLCIHPDAGVPFYDGLATIQLNLLSGNEQYITDKSHIFSLSESLIDKIEVFFNKIIKKNINFEGLKTLKSIY